MSRAIYKYAIEKTGPFALQMPTNARVLRVHDQHGIPHLWAEVDKDAELQTRGFVCVGTGWDLPECSLAYVGTAFCGSLVWHIYETAP